VYILLVSKNTATIARGIRTQNGNLRVGRITIEEPYLVIKPGISEREYFELTDEDSNCELFEGELVMGSPANTKHERIFAFLMRVMGIYCERKHLGEIVGSRLPMRLEPGTLPEPEIIFISAKRRSLLREKYLDGPADLVVEVLSPLTYRFDLGPKRRKYQEHRIKEIWFVDPIKRRVIIDYLGKKAYRTEERTKGRISSRVLSGFWLEADWLFRKKIPDSYRVLEKILGH